MRKVPDKDYRRVAPLFWFKDEFDNPLDSGRLLVPGPSAFFFFTSLEYAEAFLQQWLDAARSALPGGKNPMTGDPISRHDWGIYHSDDADRLLAVCDELAQMPGSLREEGFLMRVPYEAFIVDPPLHSPSANLPIDLDAIKAQIQRKAQERTPWT